MKRSVKAIAAVMAVVVCAIAFAGCSRQANVKGAYENAGYTVTSQQVGDEYFRTLEAFFLGYDENGVMRELDAAVKEWELLKCVKTDEGGSQSTAAILCIPSTDDFKEYFGEDCYEKNVANGFLIGGCLFIGSVEDAAYEIFKNA